MTDSREALRDALDEVALEAGFNYSNPRLKNVKRQSKYVQSGTVVGHDRSPPFAECRSPFAECRSPFAECRSPFAECRSAICERSPRSRFRIRATPPITAASTAATTNGSSGGGLAVSTTPAVTKLVVASVKRSIAMMPASKTPFKSKTALTGVGPICPRSSSITTDHPSRRPSRRLGGRS